MKKLNIRRFATPLIIGAGVISAITGLLMFFIVEPSVPTARLIGKSPEYIAFYTDTYKDEVKQQRITSAIGGCCLGTVFYASVWVILIQADGISTLDALY